MLKKMKRWYEVNYVVCLLVSLLLTGITSIIIFMLQGLKIDTTAAYVFFIMFGTTLIMCAGTGCNIVHKEEEETKMKQKLEKFFASPCVGKYMVREVWLNVDYTEELQKIWSTESLHFYAKFYLEKIWVTMKITDSENKVLQSFEDLFVYEDYNEFFMKFRAEK